MSRENSDLVVMLGEVAYEPVDQSGPTQSFKYVDIGSIDRETKKINNVKTIPAADAPSRAKQVIRAGDVLVSMTRPNLNAVALVPEELDGAIASTGFFVLRSKWIQPKFLFGLVQTDRFIDAMCALVQGALYPAVRPKDIAGFRFVLRSQTNQIQIVEKLEELLSSLEDGVAELKVAHQKLKQYRQSLLKSAVEGTLTAEWRKVNRPTENGAQLLSNILAERRVRWEVHQLARFQEQSKEPPKDWQKKYPEPVLPDFTNLPELPEGWTWTSVGLTGDVQLGRQRAPKYHAGANMVPYLRVANVFEDRIDVSDVKQMHFSKEEEETYKLSFNDILLNEGQSLELVGRPAIYRNELPRACFTNTLVRYRAEKGVVSEYALALFLHYLHSGRFRKIATITTNIAHLGASRFAEVEFPLPSTDEQLAIAKMLSEELDNINRQEGAIDLALKQSEAQRKNILESAFFGELVPQSSDNDQAKALLARIRTEREASGILPSRRKRESKRETTIMARSVEEVLKEATDWLPAQEVFRRCGIASSAETDEVEALYAELRTLDKAGRLAVEPVTDEKGRKLHDRLKLRIA